MQFRVERSTCLRESTLLHGSVVSDSGSSGDAGCECRYFILLK